MKADLGYGGAETWALALHQGLPGPKGKAVVEERGIGGPVVVVERGNGGWALVVEERGPPQAHLHIKLVGLHGVGQPDPNGQSSQQLPSPSHTSPHP